MKMGSSSPSHSSADDSLNGLILGQKIYFEDVGSVGAPPKSGPGSSSGSRSGSGGLSTTTTTTTTTTSTSRKVKVGGGGGGGGGGAVQGGGQPPRCQVEGCKVDLSDAKAYYSRHKVCGMHSKSPKVIVAGLEQRFCQQCSRSVQKL